MTVTNRRPEIEKMVVGALERFCLGLDLTYDITLGWGPLPNGQMAFAYWALVSTPNPLLGQAPLSTLIVIPDLFVDQKQIDEHVMHNLSNLRQAKAKVLNGGDKSV